MIFWWIDSSGSQEPGAKPFWRSLTRGLGILSLELKFFCARIRLGRAGVRLRLRQMSERSARASPDDTADAGHFALSHDSAAQVETSGRYRRPQGRQIKSARENKHLPHTRPWSIGHGFRPCWRSYPRHKEVICGIQPDLHNAIPEINY
jgi:hypothetical protein